MVRAPTGGRTAQTLTTEYRRAADLRAWGRRLYHRAVFLCGGDHTLTAFCPLAGQPQTRQKGFYMAFFNSAVDVLQTLVVHLEPDLAFGRYQSHGGLRQRQSGREIARDQAAHGGRRRCADRHDTCTPAFRAVRLKSAGKSLCRAYLTRSRNG